MMHSVSQFTPQRQLPYLPQACRTCPDQSTPEVAYQRRSQSSPLQQHQQQPVAGIARSRLVTKGPWTSQEDALLLDLVREIGPEKWVIIAQRLATRSGKQCRERYHNHLNPNLKRSPFSPEEEATILALYAQMGPKWANIAKHLPGRSDNAIKNYYNTALQRRQRKKTSPLSADRSNYMQRSVSQPYPTSSPSHRRRLSFSRPPYGFQLPTPDMAAMHDRDVFQLPTPDTVKVEGESYFTPFFVPSPPKSPSPQSATSNLSSSPSFERTPNFQLPRVDWKRPMLQERRLQLAPLMSRTVSEPIREKMSINNLLG
ncbi:Homeodomain-like protein [Protomyces lactucae-debilis]|uniref:Homeodomain-like protein n=1 Tax=Protomyces lactucae-debilis TaxID=2754530 RepID=A0A1Y2FAI7_PROLT|nr:Homeodomain-like protein [Protomyces lactucae-debilis]ORY80928.1 Homeodomain-like protein [Protomyces lactucae-debilis]